ncbi:uncharacterized protein YndB with AHSA1/START domain [Chryseobacterium camelliae]|uniref:Uncharacterized protein YndB with AHSA1/START domain n=2 Tax=Chryseobacterium camelliae TaxID=1265445 RepID=A0ABU0TJ61_9FLAO|nr:uncharacterized protein YndB with AHSA1/START domain [Chryseobacterium camelliae]
MQLKMLRTLPIVRDFELPVELLFKANSEKELLEKWMGTKVIKLESRKHGSYEFETSRGGNVVFKADGTIHEYIENDIIIRTFEMANMPIGVQLEFLRFEKLTDDTSKITIHIIYQSKEHRAEQLKLPFEMGLNMAHNNLQKIISEQL